MWKEIVYVMRYGHQPLSEVMAWPCSYLHRVAEIIHDSFNRRPLDPIEEEL